MYTDITEQITFISKHLNAEIVDIVNDDVENKTIFKLNDGNNVKIENDLRCIHYYKVGNQRQVADMSVEFRDFVIDRLGATEQYEERLRYCRSCLAIIADEESDITEKLIGKIPGADRQAYMEQRELLGAQALKVTEIINTPIDESDMTM